MAAVGKFITIVGNSGAGKTLLTNLLCQAGPFTSCYEQHKERPFQVLFMQDLNRYALPNQLDYLLYRAEQEWAVRQSNQVAISDGGLDLDFHLYSRYFYHKGYLDTESFALCERFYHLLRGLLPPPDLVIYLSVPLTTLVERRQIRNREIDIARSEDLALMQELLEDWVKDLQTGSFIRIDAGDDIGFTSNLERLVHRIKSLSL